MKKRWCSLLLALTLLLLCGCSGNTEPAGSSGTDPAATTVDLESNIYHQKVMELVYDPPVYDGEPPIPYDPDRQVYISLSNQDCDFYPDCYFIGTMFWVITQEHFDTDQIQLSMDINTEYEVTVADLSAHCQIPSHSSKYDLYGLQLYQYLCMQGIDWQDHAKKTIYSNTAGSLAIQYKPQSEEFQGYTALRSDYSALMDAYKAQYNAVTQADIPQFSAYRVSVSFMGLGSYEETVETVNLRIGSESYTVDIGQWRLHTSRPQEISDGITEDTGIKPGSSVKIGVPTPAIGDGYEAFDVMFGFEATENLTVTGVHQFQSGDQVVDVIGGKVQILDPVALKEDDEVVVLMEYYWDPSQPLEIAAGTYLLIGLYLHDERFQTYEGCFTTYFFLDYTVREKECSILAPCMFNRLNENVWDIYLMAFKGIDLGEYYTCYYVPIFETWRREIPEGWLQ